MNDFANKISSYLLEIRELLITKNLLIRIDDKLKRIKNGSLEKDDEDVINDLIGYLVLLKIQTQEERYKRNRDNRLKNRIANED